MSVLHKAIYRLNETPIKPPVAFLTEIENQILKFVWEQKRPQIAKLILQKRTEAGGVTLPMLKHIVNLLSSRVQDGRVERFWTPSPRHNKSTKTWRLSEQGSLQPRIKGPHEHVWKKNRHGLTETPPQCCNPQSRGGLINKGLLPEEQGVYAPK